MSTNFQRLSCDKGCCLDRAKFIAEQVYHEQDIMYNLLAEENIELNNFLHEQVMPYLNDRASIGDEAAQDLVIALVQVWGN